MDAALREAVRDIRALLAEHAPGWDVQVDERELGGQPGVVVRATHEGAEPYQWAFTAVSADPAIETVRTALERDPEFRMVKQTPVIEHRSLVVGIRRLAAEHGWAAGAVGELTDLLVHEGVLTDVEAGWVISEVHEAAGMRTAS